jgi:hypothetical protein
MTVSFRQPGEKDKAASDLEIQGVFHIHTKFSDGLRSWEKVVAIAGKQSLDFIGLADHGRPNVQSMSSQGWRNGVLVLAGTEMSVNRGHLVAMGFEMPPRSFPQNAEQSSYLVSKLGGFSVISHPFSKVSWSWGRMGDYSGLEIANADTMFKKDLLRSLPYFPALVFNPSYVLLKVMDRPGKNLRKWDELNKTDMMYGFFSADAHLFYKILFSFLRVHVLLDKPLSPEFQVARKQVFEAMRNGRFYNAVEAAASGVGLRFYGKQGGKHIAMGSQTVFDTSMTLHVEAPFSFEKEIRLISDGETVSRSTQDSLTFKPKTPGVYRVEVYIREKSPLAENIPWIVTNPIFIRKNDT